MRAIATTLLVAVAAATPSVPVLPVAFAANASVTIPYFGTHPGTLYYDLTQNKQRTDVTLPMMGSMTTIDDYTVSKEYQISGGQCNVENLDGSIPIYTLPPIPFVVFVENTTVNGRAVQHWQSTLVGQLDWFIDVTDPKDAQLVRFTANALGVATTMDFLSQVAGPQPASVFAIPSSCPAPVPPAIYRISGYATDAVTGRAIVGALIEGASTSSAASFNATTNANGVWSALVAGGTFNLMGSAAGYSASSPTPITITGSIVASTATSIVLSPIVPAGTFRSVLQWGSTPPDLDTTFYFGTSATHACTVWYGNRYCRIGNTVATLDRDATQGYGPETLTLSNLANVGPMQYWVHVYNQGRTFTPSNTRVTVYTANGGRVIQAPAMTGTPTWWHVYDIDGATGNINIVNQYSN